jgi:hypothetical protein
MDFVSSTIKTIALRVAPRGLLCIVTDALERSISGVWIRLWKPWTFPKAMADGFVQVV